jgi:hypothetical protein
VGSDPPPDDMRLAGYALSAVAEGRPAIVIPRHLEHARMSSYPFDAQDRPERPVRSRQVRDECLGDHPAEQGLLLPREIFQCRSKRGRSLKRRHEESAAPSVSRRANMSSADSCTIPRPPRLGAPAPFWRQAYSRASTLTSGTGTVPDLVRSRSALQVRTDAKTRLCRRRRGLPRLHDLSRFAPRVVAPLSPRLP